MSEYTEDFATAVEIAEEFGLEVETLARWRCDDYGPTYYKVGRKIRYRRSDITAWIESLRHEPKTVHLRK